MKDESFSTFPLGNPGSSEPIWIRFRSQLPRRIQVLGRKVIIKASVDNQLEALISDKVPEKVLRSEMQEWESRKFLGSTLGGEPFAIAECSVSVREASLVGDFLYFYIRQPICPRILSVKDGKSFRPYRGRQAAINQAFLTWFALNFYQRDRNGELTFAVPCAGYRSRIEKCYLHPNGVRYCLCAASVLDPSGFCPHHRSPTAKTLFNHYPLFDIEDVPVQKDFEWALTEEEEEAIAKHFKSIASIQFK